MDTAPAPPLRFRAPWGALLITLSLVYTALLVGITLVVLVVLPPEPGAPRVLTAALPLAVLLACLPFVVRGYVLTGRELLILRPGWVTRWPLAGLVSAEADPGAMSRSIRLLGNGGLFVFHGWYRNKKLGNYRAFCTDPRRAVVLRFPGRALVVTPDNPELFIAEVLRLQGA